MPFTYQPEYVDSSLRRGNRSIKALGMSVGSLNEPFDPNAQDGDGDGVVQDGTPYERPAIVSAVEDVVRKPSLIGRMFGNRQGDAESGAAPRVAPRVPLRPTVRMRQPSSAVPNPHRGVLGHHHRFRGMTNAEVAKASVPTSMKEHAHMSAMDVVGTFDLWLLRNPQHLRAPLLDGQTMEEKMQILNRIYNTELKQIEDHHFNELLAMQQSIERVLEGTKGNNPFYKREDLEVQVSTRFNSIPDYSPEGVLLMQQQIEKALDESPLFRDVVDNFGMPAMYFDTPVVDKDGVVIDSAWSGVYNPKTHAVTISRLHFDKGDRPIEEVETPSWNSKPRWSAGTTAVDTIRHEYGHWLNAKIRRDHMFLYKDMSDPLDRADDANRFNTWIHSMRRERIKIDSVKKADLTNEFYTHTQYGTWNGDEMLAEAFSLMTDPDSDNANLVSKALRSELGNMIGLDYQESNGNFISPKVRDAQPTRAAADQASPMRVEQGLINDFKDPVTHQIEFDEEGAPTRVFSVGDHVWQNDDDTVAHPEYEKRDIKRAVDAHFSPGRLGDMIAVNKGDDRKGSPETDARTGSSWFHRSVSALAMGFLLKRPNRNPYQISRTQTAEELKELNDNYPEYEALLTGSISKLDKDTRAEVEAAVERAFHLQQGIADSEVTNTSKYRVIPGHHSVDQLGIQVGDTIPVPATNFTPNLDLLVHSDGQARGGDTILEIVGDHHSISHTYPADPKLFLVERTESVTQGNFQVVAIEKDAAGNTRVKIQQVDTYDPRLGKYRVVTKHNALAVREGGNNTIIDVEHRPDILRDHQQQLQDSTYKNAFVAQTARMLNITPTEARSKIDESKGPGQTYGLNPSQFDRAHNHAISRQGRVAQATEEYNRASVRRLDDGTVQLLTDQGWRDESPRQGMPSRRQPREEGLASKPYGRGPRRGNSTSRAYPRNNGWRQTADGRWREWDEGPDRPEDSFDREPSRDFQAEAMNVRDKNNRETISRLDDLAASHDPKDVQSVDISQEAKDLVKKHKDALPYSPNGVLTPEEWTKLREEAIRVAENRRLIGESNSPEKLAMMARARKFNDDNFISSIVRQFDASGALGQRHWEALRDSLEKAEAGYKGPSPDGSAAIQAQADAMDARAARIGAQMRRPVGALRDNNGKPLVRRGISGTTAGANAPSTPKEGALTTAEENTLSTLATRTTGTIYNDDQRNAIIERARTNDNALIRAIIRRYDEHGLIDEQQLATLEKMNKRQGMASRRVTQRDVARGAYTDQEQWEDYNDIGGGPPNMGGRRPNDAEWGDYIVESNELHAEDLIAGRSPLVDAENAAQKEKDRQKAQKKFDRKEAKRKARAEVAYQKMLADLPPKMRDALSDTEQGLPSQRRTNVEGRLGITESSKRADLKLRKSIAKQETSAKKYYSAHKELLKLQKLKETEPDTDSESRDVEIARLEALMDKQARTLTRAADDELAPYLTELNDLYAAGSMTREDYYRNFGSAIYRDTRKKEEREITEGIIMDIAMGDSSMSYVDIANKYGVELSRVRKIAKDNEKARESRRLEFGMNKLVRDYRNDLMVRDRLAGMGYREIAKKYGTTSTAVGAILRQRKIRLAGGAGAINAKRNTEISEAFLQGTSIEALSKKYKIAPASIKNIIRTFQKKQPQPAKPE